MTHVRDTWDVVADRMSALGLKLKLHTEQEVSEDRKELTSAFEQLTKAVNDIFQGLGSAAHDPAVRENARDVARAFGEAVDATVAEATSRIKKHS